MKNIKVRVKNEVESEEVQKMLLELRGDFCFGGKLYFNPHLNLITMNKNGVIANIELDGFEYEELTIPQLCDLVVLKRNSINDATHACETMHKRKGYLASDNVEYFWSYGDDCWFISSNSFESEKLKPIDKKEMKEFLVSHDNKWTLQLLDADTEENSFRVAVPSGENVAYKDKDDGSIYFIGLEMGYRDVELIWQRHTQPEELPFVDDEPKHSHYFKDVSDIDTMDVYEVLKRFEVTDPCLQHIVKKALCAGQRGHKDFKKDLQDILDTAVRAVDINK